jgi:hypothetical protein
MIKLLNRLYGSHLGLLLFLGLIFFIPAVKQTFSSRVFFDLIISMVFLFALAGIFDHKKLRQISISLAALAFGSQWSEHLWPDMPELEILSNLISALFLAYVSCAILHGLFRCKVVTAEVLCGAVSAYLLIGMTFACLFASLETTAPGSFSTQLPVVDERGVPGFVYFSFVCLTSVGFGDFTPISELARSLTVLEAVIGQMYMAIIIASLVGKKNTLQ